MHVRRFLAASINPAANQSPKNIARAQYNVETSSFHPLSISAAAISLRCPNSSSSPPIDVKDGGGKRSFFNEQGGAAITRRIGGGGLPEEVTVEKQENSTRATLPMSSYTGTGPAPEIPQLCNEQWGGLEK